MPATRPPGPRRTYAPPLQALSPVQAEAGVTTSAAPVRVPASASTSCQVTWAWRPATRALAATAGWASRASIDSRPWMVDSAPELRLTVRSGLMPSKVRPVAGSYMATPAGLLPKYQAPAIPARSANAGRWAAAAVRSRFWRVASAP